MPQSDQTKRTKDNPNPRKPAQPGSKERDNEQR